MWPGAECRSYREGDWCLEVTSQLWSRGLWAEILGHLSSEVRTHHPQTKRLYYPVDGTAKEFYLKIYHRPDFLGSIKDLFRASKAFLALRQAKDLLREGFHTPLAVAAGEQRTLRFVKKAFLLTLSVEGTLLPDFLEENYSRPSDGSVLQKKREYLRQLASEVRRLHQSGFIHGDLVPYNIMVQVQGDGLIFFFMDNDRTRRYPSWIPNPLWKRNLVQLNRVSLPGISQRDRVRFLHFYFGCRTWAKKKRRLIRSLDEITQRRIRKMQR